MKETPSKKMKVVENMVEAFDSKFFKSLSEPVRVQILKCLLLYGRSDIASIAEHLPQDRSVISRHLSLMQDAGLVMGEKEGRYTFYTINSEEFVGKLEELLKQIQECIPICCPPSR